MSVEDVKDADPDFEYVNQSESCDLPLRVVAPLLVIDFARSDYQLPGWVEWDCYECAEEHRFERRETENIEE